MTHKCAAEDNMRIKIIIKVRRVGTYSYVSIQQ